MSLVLDASAVIDLLLHSDRGERLHDALAERAPAEHFTVAHLDAEVFSGLARHHRAGLLAADTVGRTVEPALGARGHPPAYHP